ncbi:MAG: hypothetical protein ACHQHK_13420, partial [Dongiales bacterium]
MNDGIFAAAEAVCKGKRDTGNWLCDQGVGHLLATLGCDLPVVLPFISSWSAKADHPRVCQPPGGTPAETSDPE